MQVFGNYASYYDLLYRDKDYVGEANHVHTLIQRYMPEAETILELGCGTGIHASLLADKGYQICGVDRSKEMLESAQQRLLTLSQEQASKLQFVLGDMQTVRLDKKFDVVISLFHVVSYQTTNQALQAAFATAKEHLKPGGIFLFDCWYGPAVLSDRPMVRVKRLEDEKIMVTRIAEPVLQPNQNTVDVKYQVLIRDRTTDAVEELREVHAMRYLFKPEVDWLFSQHEFDSIATGEWMTDREPGCNTWNVYFIGRYQTRSA
ncbi:class I SAM-dependent DNA methyltransferase [Microseira sp. BLCC-F43]|jgi:SAM-dependent methyltransferase|uniref:class I SAM-dependent DNA methyltransferase n=1 Tax=Microseira sp. BLCC-F43 TaxID=3153602 RepID=UPI0035BB3DBC